MLVSQLLQRRNTTLVAKVRRGDNKGIRGAKEDKQKWGKGDVVIFDLKVKGKE